MTPTERNNARTDPTPHPDGWTFALTEGGPPGETDYSTRTVSLRRDVLTDGRAGKVVLHELLHVARGPTNNPEAEEAAVERAAAALLIPFDRLCSAVAAPGATEADIAAACNVNRATLNARYASLTSSEHQLLTRIRSGAGHLDEVAHTAEADPQGVIDLLNTPTRTGRSPSWRAEQ